MKVAGITSLTSIECTTYSPRALIQQFVLVTGEHKTKNSMYTHDAHLTSACQLVPPRGATEPGATRCSCMK